ncbi:MAG: SDR family NAD(P)-dependent oxidoreductase [Alphaproteobacteria bacterium]
MRDPSHVLITGASSGIGAALARRYARQGRVLSLCGRDAARLAAVAGDCAARGAEVDAALGDVADRASVAAWVAARDAASPIDLAIANAGISGGTSGGAAPDGLVEPRAQHDAIMAVNVDGVVNTGNAAMVAMAPRRRGQVAIMSSLASFRGFPGAPAYCAGKAMVRTWGEALRPDAAAAGIEVCVVCPGYVRSPMTDRNDFPMPFLVDAGSAAAIIEQGLRRNRARIVFPLRLYLLLRVFAALPEPLLDRIMARLPRKRVLDGS